MKTTIMGSIPNMKINENFEYKNKNEVFLKKSEDEETLLKDKGLKDYIGESMHDSFENDVMIQINVQEDSEKQCNLSTQVHNSKSILNDVLFSFWLVKNNSIHIESLIGIDDEEITISSSPGIYFDSSGNFSENHFDSSELAASADYYNILTSEKTDEINKSEDVNMKNLGNFTTHYTNFTKDTDRLSIARLFIDEARSTPLILPKITFYISALEALLSNSTAGVAKQVSERTAKILESELDKRIKINELVYESYSIRSTYIHGSNIKMSTLEKKVKKLSLETIEDIPMEIDNVLRRLFILFLTELREEIDFDDEEFSVWIKEITLG